MHRIFILSITILSFAINQDIDFETEYIIYTSPELEEAVQTLSDFYNNPYDFGYTNNANDITLLTKIITTNSISL